MREMLAEILGFILNLPGMYVVWYFLEPKESFWDYVDTSRFSDNLGKDLGHGCLGCVISLLFYGLCIGAFLGGLVFVMALAGK